MGRGETEFFPIADQQPAVCGTAKRVRFFQDRVEHWSEVAGRGVDNLQHFGGRRLLF